MNITEWKVRRKAVKDMELLTKEQLKLSDELRSNGEKVKGMINSPGWGIVKKYLDNNAELIKNKFRYCTDEKELFKVQQELLAQETLIRLIENSAKL